MEFNTRLVVERWLPSRWWLLATRDADGWPHSVCLRWKSREPRVRGGCRVPGQRLSWLFDGVKILIYGQSSFTSKASLPKQKNNYLDLQLFTSEGTSGGLLWKDLFMLVITPHTINWTLLFHTLAETFLLPPSNVFVYENVRFFNSVQRGRHALLLAADCCVVSRSFRRFEFVVFTMDKVLVPTVDGNCQAFLPDNDKNVGILTTCVQFHLQLLS